jgi:plastocyanin
MMIPVRVMNEEDFQAWLAANRKTEQPSPSAGAVTTLDLVAKDLLFDKESIETPAGEPFDVRLDNQDSVPHNFSIYTDETAATPIFQGDIVQGVANITYSLPGLDAASYFFRCDVHPTTMTGTLTVK